MAWRRKSARYNDPREFAVDIDGIKLIEAYSVISRSADGQPGSPPPSFSEFSAAYSARKPVIDDLFWGPNVDQHMDAGSWNTTSLIETAFVVWTFGSFVTAFCTEMGKRLSGTMVDWASKIRLRQKRGVVDKVDLSVEVGDAVTIIELEMDFSDEARWALLDLDINAPAIRGHRLRWNTHTQAWEPTGADRARRFWSLGKLSFRKRRVAPRIDA